MSEFCRVCMRVLIFTSLAMFSASAPVWAQANRSAVKVEKVYWSDGDSGRLDNVKFRLANVDAPETGSMKQRGGAKCESERELGYEAKAFLVALAKSGSVHIVPNYGYDRYQRLIVDLSVNGQDIGKTAVSAGHLKAWPHRKGRALAPKPNWCAP